MYRYRCIECGFEMKSEASPSDFRMATGRSISCCNEPMKLEVETSIIKQIISPDIIGGIK